MFVLDNVFVTIYFICVSVTSSAKEALISPKWWVYGDFCQQKYMFSRRVTHTHSYITHEPINTSEWVHMCTLCTCIQTQTVQITCYVSVLSLICSSGFGWFVFSCTACQPHSFSTAHTCSSVSNPSPSTCPCFPFPSPPTLYSKRNVWYVDQQTGCVISLLSSREKAKQGRGGEKQPCRHVHSCTLHHLPLPDLTAPLCYLILRQVFCMIYLPGSLIGYCCIWILFFIIIFLLLLFLNNHSRAHVNPG